jgi:Ca-activated chloride channel homolog
VTVPGLGAISLSGFEHPGFFLLVLLPIAVLLLYIGTQVVHRGRVRRFSGPGLLDSVAPQRPNPWRHVPMAVLLVALVVLTVALAGPTHDVHVPRNRAVIMLVIDESQSMRATDVAPTRLAAAQQAAKRFAQQLTPGVNLGLIAFAGTANVLVSPTTRHEATIAALDNLRPADSTATGDAIFAALQSIATVAAVLRSGETTPPPARIVLLSDGKANKPDNPDDLHGAYTAARAAKEQGVPISTISFGTRGGYVAVNDHSVAVPVDGSMMRRIAQLSGGQAYNAANIDELEHSYAAVQQQVGYQTVAGPASAGWLRLAVITATIAIIGGLAINRRLPV